jgi:hypothetical protein
MEHGQSKNNIIWKSLTDWVFYFYSIGLLLLSYLPWVLPDSFWMDWPLRVPVAIANFVTIYPWAYVLSPSSDPPIMTFVLIPLLIIPTGIVFSIVSLRIANAWTKWILRNPVVWFFCWIIITWTVSIIVVKCTGRTYEMP